MGFDVEVPGVREHEHGPPEAAAIANAKLKAAAVAERVPAAAVLGVDTVVELDGRIYGKPPDARAARATLEALGGRVHSVLSAVCIVDGGGARTATGRTRVGFRDLSSRLIDWYVESGEWRERAGGYAIQGQGAALVREIAGDYLNVVGLPVAALLELEPELLWRWPRGT